MRLHVNYACAIGTRLNLDLLFVAQDGGVVLGLGTTASLNRHSWAERGYCNESDVVLCVK